jgi:hypothetical protein
MYSVDSKISIGLKALFSIKTLDKTHFFLGPLELQSSFPRYSTSVSAYSSCSGHHFSCKTEEAFERSTPNRCSTKLAKPLYPLGTSEPAVISLEARKYP